MSLLLTQLTPPAAVDVLLEEPPSPEEDLPEVHVFDDGFVPLSLGIPVLADDEDPIHVAADPTSDEDVIVASYPAPISPDDQIDLPSDDLEVEDPWGLEKMVEAQEIAWLSEDDTPAAADTDETPPVDDGLTPSSTYAVWVTEESIDVDELDDLASADDIAPPTVPSFVAPTDVLLEEEEEDVSGADELTSPATIPHVDDERDLAHDLAETFQSDEFTPPETYTPPPSLPDVIFDDAEVIEIVDEPDERTDDVVPSSPDLIPTEDSGVKLAAPELELPAADDEPPFTELPVWVDSDTADPDLELELLLDVPDEIVVPPPTPPPPPPPPPPPAGTPPVQGGFSGGTGGKIVVWNFGTPSRRYVNFAKRPAPRYPYDFWQRLSDPPPEVPKKSAPREVRWTQRFERTIHPDPEDKRPLYARLLDLIKKKR
ncbi:MAG: hypothetical protein ACRD1X_17925 [Vicinamibacteria bacterium]